MKTIAKVALLFATAALLAFSFFFWQLRIMYAENKQNLQAQSLQQHEHNQRLQVRNQMVKHEVDMLQSAAASALYEEKARENYGMIHAQEIFIQLDAQAAQKLPPLPELEALLQEEQKHVQIPVDLKAQHEWKK